MKVFIADDSAIIRERLVSMLSEIDKIEIIGEAKDANEAIKKVKKLKPDVVILDIRMPGNGINVLRRIKDTKNAPIAIMFTNYPFDQYKKKCEKTGAEYFFSKAEGVEKIIEVLNQMI